MRRLLGLLVSTGLLTSLVTAWSPLDHEIFRLNDEILKAEGSNTTFYSFLNTPPSSTHAEINKAARTRSKALHPDKAIPAIIAKRSPPNPLTAEEKAAKKPRVTKGLSKKERDKIAAEATTRYQRLNVVAEILKGEGRERYDHFLKNGFPIWRGTGYYYARFRPGLVSVLVGLAVVMGGGGHYFALYVTWKRHREFVQRYIAHARRMAWGNDSGIPGLEDVQRESSSVVPSASAVEDDQGMALNRRQKRMQEKESKKKDSGKGAKAARANGISRPVDGGAIGQGAQGVRKKVVAPNGKVLIVDGEGNVFLEEQTEEGDKHEMLLDVDEIARPTIFQTALFRLPIWVYSRTAGRLFSTNAGVGPDEPLMPDGGITMNPDENSDEALDEATSQNANAEARKRKSRGKAKAR